MPSSEPRYPPDLPIEYSIRALADALFIRKRSSHNIYTHIVPRSFVADEPSSIGKAAYSSGSQGHFQLNQFIGWALTRRIERCPSGSSVVGVELSSDDPADSSR
jgi:hypothetical protein